MKKSFLISALLCSLFISCSSSPKIELEGERAVYRDISYTPKMLRKLTEKQVLEDIEYLKYIFPNLYAGYDEAVELGFNLEQICQDVTEAVIKEKEVDGTISRNSFGTILWQKFSAGFPLPDQHIMVWNSLKRHYSLFYSEVYFEKTEDGYLVKKSGVEEIKTGGKFTGNENNLFKMLADGQILYRFGIISNANVKTANLSVDNKDFFVRVETEESIESRQYWYNLKETERTLYFSLSDCEDVYGLNNEAKYIQKYFDEYLEKISRASEKNKTNLIFDLRSNTGGRYEFPAKILAAVLYPEHTKEEQEQIANLFSIKINENCKQLISPVTLQKKKELYNGEYKNHFEKTSKRNQEFLNAYWKSMKNNPVRTYIDSVQYDSEYSEFPETDFKGNLYILINRKTASASELGIGMAYLLKDMGINIQLIGEMSSGCVKYVSCGSIGLPNSGVYIYAGTVAGLSPIFNVPNFKGESKGFYPDYWATNENILENLIYCTGDNDLKEVLTGLEKSQL